MGRGKVYTEEERLARYKESQRKARKKYYDANSEKLLAERRAKRGAEKRRNLIVSDMKTGEEFEYSSVRECHEDMGIDVYRINMGLNKGLRYKGYTFTRRD